jgi:hypothetical protein
MAISRMAVVDKAMLSSLQVCRADQSTRYLDKFPDFLILGPQRTGTTWLAENLRLHPNVFVTEPKEVYYFSGLGEPAAWPEAPDDLEWYLQHFHESKLTIVAKQFNALRRFRKLYKPMVRGEATATYAAAISDAAMDDLLAMNPNLKCILMLRNPIQRAWSHVKKDLLNVSHLNVRERDLSEVSESEILDFILSPYQIKCGKYADQINRWQSRLKSGNLFIGVFDDLSQAPERLLLDVYRFLGIPGDAKLLPKLVRTSIERTDSVANAGKREMPASIQSCLANLFADDIPALEKSFDCRLVS